MRQLGVADPTTLDLRDVRAFCAVADLGSLTAAARTIGETKGNVSRRLDRLEAALGVALVRRGSRGVQTTDEGARYRASVRRALELFEEAAIDAQEGDAQPRGTLRVTAPTDFGIGALAPVVARYTQTFPAVRVEVMITDRPLDLDAHRIDVALRVGARLRDSSLIAHRVVDLELGFFAAPAYLDRARAPKRLEELDAHAVISVSALGEVLSARLVARARTRRIALRPSVIGDGAFVREAALAGAGIALLPTILAARDVADRRLVRVLKEHRLAERRTLWLLHPAVHSGSTKVRAFRALVSEAFASPCRPRGRAD